MPAAGSGRAGLRVIVEASWFGHGSTGLVLLNLALMCLPYHGMSAQYEDGLEAAASVITWLFIAEMAMKLLAIGCKAYWSDGWNVLDGTIVIMSIVEMVLTAIFAGGGVKLSFLRILRMLRVARMLRLMKAWKGLYKIVMTVVEAMPQFSNVLILLFLITMICALLGMQLFGGAFNEASGYGDAPPLAPLPRHNFDYFVPAMLTCFVLSTGGWYTPMLAGVDVLGPAACIYYVVVVLLGTYVMMNLLVAVLLQLFAEAEERERAAVEDADEAEKRAEAEIQAAEAAEEAKEEEAKAEEAKAEAIVKVAEASATPFPTVGIPPALKVTPSEDDAERGVASSQQLHADDETHDEALRLIHPDDVALNCLPPTSELRQRCRSTVEHPAVDSTLMAAVILSSLLLALDSPRNDPDSALALVLRLSNYAFTLLFLAEAVLKAAAYGLLHTPRAYLKNGWNCLDFTILLISLGSILAEAVPALGFLKPLRALRVLRPLRLLSRNDGMRLVLASLAEALPAVFNVFGVMLALQLVSSVGRRPLNFRCLCCWLPLLLLTAFDSPLLPGLCHSRHAAIHGLLRLMHGPGDLRPPLVRRRVRSTITDASSTARTTIAHIRTSASAATPSSTRPPVAVAAATILTIPISSATPFTTASVATTATAATSQPPALPARRPSFRPSPHRPSTRCAGTVRGRSG